MLLWSTTSANSSNRVLAEKLSKPEWTKLIRKIVELANIYESNNIHTCHLISRDQIVKYRFSLVKGSANGNPVNKIEKPVFSFLLACISWYYRQVTTWLFSKMYTIENYLIFVSDIPNESLLKCFKSVYDQGENWKHETINSLPIEHWHYHIQSVLNKGNHEFTFLFIQKDKLFEFQACWVAVLL